MTIAVFAPHIIDVKAYQGTSLDQRATSFALVGTAFSGNLGSVQGTQTVLAGN